MLLTLCMLAALLKEGDSKDKSRSQDFRLAPSTGPSLLWPCAGSGIPWSQLDSWDESERPAVWMWVSTQAWLSGERRPHWEESSTQMEKKKAWQAWRKQQFTKYHFKGKCGDPRIRENRGATARPSYLLTELGANPESPADKKNPPWEKNLAGFRWKPCLGGCLQRTYSLCKERARLPLHILLLPFPTPLARNFPSS